MALGNPPRGPYYGFVWGMQDPMSPRVSGNRLLPELAYRAMESHPRCELCGRGSPGLTKHHLIPRTRHRNKRNKKNFARREVRERIALLCPACHRTVHSVLSQKELEYEYNSVDLLRSHPQIARFIKWVRKRPAGQGIRIRRASKLREGMDPDRRRRRRQRLQRNMETVE